MKRRTKIALGIFGFVALFSVIFFPAYFVPRRSDEESTDSPLKTGYLDCFPEDPAVSRAACEKRGCRFEENSDTGVSCQFTDAFGYTGGQIIAINFRQHYFYQSGKCRDRWRDRWGIKVGDSFKQKIGANLRRFDQLWPTFLRIVPFSSSKLPEWTTDKSRGSKLLARIIQIAQSQYYNLYFDTRCFIVIGQF